jgi:putative copper export protein
MMPQEPLLTWWEPVTQYLEFLSVFLPAGAVGFRYSSLRAGLAEGDSVYQDAARRAAGIGLAGTVIGAMLLARALPALAARRHVTVTALVTHSVQPALQLLLPTLAVIGFLMAQRRLASGWPLAAAGVVLGQLRGILGGQWLRLVNPLHVLFGGLWIGTLFVLVVAGISAVLRDEPAGPRRGAIVADMVNRFSPLALVASGFLVLFGVITAWQHLRVLSALWTTPYGYALIAKLCVVLVVFGLGTWNWRRRRPALGSEDSAHAIRRSATGELAAAAVVLACTAVLVSLPSPREGRGAASASAPGRSPVEAPH